MRRVLQLTVELQTGVWRWQLTEASIQQVGVRKHRAPLQGEMLFQKNLYDFKLFKKYIWPKWKQIRFVVKKEVPCIIMSFRGTGRRLIVEWTHELLQMRANQRWSLEVSDARETLLLPSQVHFSSFFDPDCQIITFKMTSFRKLFEKLPQNWFNWAWCQNHWWGPDYLRRNSELKYCFINVSSLSKPYGLVMASRSLLLD